MLLVLSFFSFPFLFSFRDYAHTRAHARVVTSSYARCSRIPRPLLFVSKMGINRTVVCLIMVTFIFCFCFGFSALSLFSLSLFFFFWFCFLFLLLSVSLFFFLSASLSLSLVLRHYVFRFTDTSLHSTGMSRSFNTVRA